MAVAAGSFCTLSQIQKSLPSTVATLLIKEFKAGTSLITLPVQWGDLDAFQHLNNVATMRYFESARMAYFYQVFGPAMLKHHPNPSAFSDLVNGRSYGPIVKNVFCNYRCQITFPDTVTVGIKVPQSSIQKDRFEQHFVAVSHKLGRICADGRATIVMFDYTKQQKADISPILLKAIEASNSENEELSKSNSHPR